MPALENQREPCSASKIDWVEAEKRGVTLLFTTEITAKLGYLYNNVYDDAESIGAEIHQVATMLQESAARLLPCVQPRKGRKWRDDVLSGLCAKSRSARAAWKDAGCPSSGPLCDEKSRLRRAVRKRVRWCAARSESERGD